MARERYIYHARAPHPIPPVESQTEYIKAGDVTFGIEYRLLDEAIGKANYGDRMISNANQGHKGPYDRGVAVHIFDNKGGELTEWIKFDCFDEDPHIHYIDASNGVNDLRGIDIVADGDPLSFALDRIKARLPQMLVEAGGADIAERVDQASIDEALPRVTEAAYRARFNADLEAVHRDAVSI